jgi:two-component system NtrC family sensor kinase
MKTIGSRLLFTFAMCLAFMLASTSFHYENVIGIKNKLILMERFNDLRDDLLELRRYEKNVFLAGDRGDVGKLTSYLLQTTNTFNELKDQIKNIMGTQEFEQYWSSLASYEKLVYDGMDEKRLGTVEYVDSQIRDKGKLLNDYTDKLIETKRRRIDRAINTTLVIPFVFFVLFLAVFAFMLWTVRKNISKPLSILQAATEKVSKGDFEQIHYPAGRGDEISSCISAFNKMTQEIKTRQAQLLHSRKMASIGTFTSGIAHELNNPINNISLLMETLMEEEDFSNAERSKLYQDLMGQADRAAEIVKGLLEFSRTDQKHLEKLSLEDLVDKTVRLVKNKINLQQIKYKKSVNTPLQPIWIEKSRLQQALLNLLLNAIQAMPGGGTLSIVLRAGETPDGIRIDVADTGIGIPADQLDSVFDPFFTTKKEGEGTGLGLSVTYGIIKNHGGRITVQSTPGKGTCFSIFLNTKAKHETEQGPA